MKDDPVVDKIISARVRMLLTQPFFGNLATRLKIVDATEWCPTCATDGRHLYYNKDFVNKLDKKELEFVIAHEVMHCVYDHMGRRGSRDPRLWNCAADYVINLEIVDSGVGRLPTTVEPLYDTKYRGMAANEVYDILKEEQDNGKGDDNMDSFDMHLDPEGDDGDGGGEGEEGEGNDGKKGRVRMSEEERKQLESEIKQAVQQAAKAAGAGNCPAGVKRMIEDLTHPQMDWRDILQSQIESSVKNDYTFQTPSRKSWSCGCYLPGMKKEEALDVHVALDTSGSICNKMLKDFLSEVYGIMEAFADFKVRVWCFDTNVHNYQEFTPDNMDELLEYDIQGGGGTTFEANWDFMKDEGIVPDQFLMLTDGYCWNSWGEEDYCDTIFLIHGDPQKRIVAPWGMTLHYEE